MTYDAIIVGGSYAGISAALQLARARRRIAVIDAALRRNRFASSSHGFLGQDGRAPGDIAADAKAQLLAYPTVEWVEGEAVEANGAMDAFAVRLGDGREQAARRLVLATGVTDELPDVPGLAERWGKGIYHCPYCHGYELAQGPVGVLAVGPISMHQALLLPDWGPTTLLLNETFEPDASELEQMAKRGVTIESGRVSRISGHADVEFEGGRTLSFSGLFTAPRSAPTGTLAEQLGCRFEDGPLGRFIWTDERKSTSVEGVTACGDAARASGSVALAVGDGALAGVMTHSTLIFT